MILDIFLACGYLYEFGRKRIISLDFKNLGNIDFSERFEILMR